MTDEELLKELFDEVPIIDNNKKGPKKTFPTKKQLKNINICNNCLFLNKEIFQCSFINTYVIHMVMSNNAKCPKGEW